MVAQLSDTSLIEAFETGSLDPKLFNHEMHLRVGWLYVCEYPLAVAVQKFSGHLKSWAKALGVEAKYHETITWFFMLILNERQTMVPMETFEAFLKANPDLTRKNPSILELYYRPETLKSAKARAHYVLPDRLESHVAA